MIWSKKMKMIKMTAPRWQLALSSQSFRSPSHTPAQRQIVEVVVLMLLRTQLWEKTSNIKLGQVDVWALSKIWIWLYCVPTHEGHGEAPGTGLLVHSSCSVQMAVLLPVVAKSIWRHALSDVLGCEVGQRTWRQHCLILIRSIPKLSVI